MFKSTNKIIPTFLITALFVLTSSAQAARIGGKLVADSPETYKIVAVNKNGSAVFSNVASSGKFSIKVKRGTTLQLVDSLGRYKGPIVSARGTKAYPALSGLSGKIGRVTLNTGFAVNQYNAITMPYFLARPKISYSSSTGPRGANKFGFVEVLESQSAKNIRTQAGELSEGQDSDKDGLPDLLDIDDDGDLILDIVDQVPHTESEFQGEIYSTLRLDLVDSLNVNSGSISDSLIDSLISEHLILRINVRNNGDKTISAVNVDCQGLTYCAAEGGTATIRMDNGPLAEDELWVGYDPEADGLPNLQIVEDIVPATIGIRPHATREQLRTGDTVLMSVINTDNSTVSVPALVPFVFLTGPALKSYVNDGNTSTMTYPIAEASLGTSGMNPFVLANGSIALTFWKPQRKNIEGAESEGYFDMGGLSYGVSLAVGSGVYTCNADEYSELSSTLSKRSDANNTSVLRDSALDTAASESNTLSYTLDLASCLSRQGVETAGAIVTLALEATSDVQDSTSQFIYFQLP